MTATAIHERTIPTTVGSRGDALVGTGMLTRFVLRRDRITLPAWLLGSTLLLSFFVAVVLPGLAGSDEQLLDLRRIMEGTTGALLGPGYGRDDITIEVYVTSVYGLFFFVLAALMSMQLVTRHTRAAEQDGRAELLRAGVVGRHAQLTAALVVAVCANVLLALLLAGVMIVNGYDGGPGLLFGASVGAVGLVFAGIAALTVQVTEYSRAATGMAGAVLGMAWVIRAVGDMTRDYGGPLSWFSPLAWSHQTRPYVEARWWPLLLSLSLAAGAAATGYGLSARRDVGAGLVAVRAGSPVAAPWLRSPLALVFRLQRGSLIAWTVALVACGLVLGGIGEQVADPDDMSDSRLEMFGGSPDTLFDGYLGMMTLLIAFVAGIMVILAVQAMRAEETSGRAEPVLAAATSRFAWVGSHLAVVAVGLVGLLLVAGLATGVGAAIASGEGSYVAEVTAAHLAHAPSLLVVLGVATLLYGVGPKAIGATWAVLGYGLFVGLFGAVMDLPSWMRNLSPMDHGGLPPLDSVSWPALLILLVLAAGLMAAGLAGFGRRDLETR